MSEKRYIPIELVFVGQRTNRKGKRIYKWLRADNKEHYSDYDKAIVPASVGGVYVFHETEDGSAVSVKGQEYAPKFIRRHDNEDDVLQWAVEDEAAKNELQLKSLNTKAAKIEPLDDMLANIRKLAKDLNSLERKALFAKIADVIFRA